MSFSSRLEGGMSAPSQTSEGWTFFAEKIGVLLSKEKRVGMCSHIARFPFRSLCGGDRCYRGRQLTGGLGMRGDEPHPAWTRCGRLGAAEHVEEESQPLGAWCPGRLILNARVTQAKSLHRPTHHFPQKQQ